MADGAVRLQAATTAGAWLEVAAPGRLAVQGELRDGVVVYPNAEPGGADVVVVLGDGLVEEQRVLRAAEASATARYALRLGPALRQLRVRHGRAEVVDRHGKVAFHTKRAIAVDQRGTRRPVSIALAEGDGWTLSATVDTEHLVFPVIVDPQWTFAAVNTWTGVAR